MTPLQSTLRCSYRSNVASEVNEDENRCDMEPLRSMLTRNPFVPFRIYISDQAHYDVYNPRMCMLGGAWTVIGVNRTDHNSDLFDEPVIVANRHITRVEPLVEEMV